MAKHTPGPWPLKSTGDGKRILVGDGLVEGPGGYEVAEVYSDDCPSEVAWANAHLIAAAPDLLAALKDQLDSHWATWMAARAEVEGVALSKQLFEKEPDVIRARKTVARFEA